MGPSENICCGNLVLICESNVFVGFVFWNGRVNTVASVYLVYLRFSTSLSFLSELNHKQNSKLFSGFLLCFPYCWVPYLNIK